MPLVWKETALAVLPGHLFAIGSGFGRAWALDIDAAVDCYYRPMSEYMGVARHCGMEDVHVTP